VESTPPVTDTSTDTPSPEAERLVTTANVTPKTANSNSLLPNTIYHFYSNKKTYKYIHE
jgi:hypothetical protein